MKPAERGFSRMARWYRALEFLAFGRDLERARFAHLEALAGARRILLLGEGDGRCAQRLAALAPAATLVAVDASPGMIAQAQARLAVGRAAGRVRFIQADARTVDLGPEPFDAVTTLFFLDCFQPEEVAGLIARTGAALTPDATWVFADFAVPAAGWRRARARLWLGWLYRCFGWETGLAVRILPPSEALLAAAGWQPQAVRQWQHGLLRSAVWRRG